ncbi:hypothetical protein NECAME_14068 [Necator americanus]|uniref:Uncharacterized protein n=1 Tax=Necator americanus TaxID=51031 RepID=W2SQ94_NECAM|nr:hypothetical protein NECAME_14068 [Necator americanus]ETN71889.1 hypothetical protein NECAME_14068 [Necator americanus]
MMVETPVLFFVILHWCIALPMIAPLMTSFNVTYDAKDTMEVLVPPSSLAIDLLYDWRQLNPIMNGFLSCVQPWMCLFFNKEIRNKLKGIVGCRQKQNEPNQGSMFKQSTPLSRR